jgi:hypothetical protein
MNMASSLRFHLQRTLDRLRHWWKKEPDLPTDPFAHRMAPVGRGPKGRSGAAVVAKPEELSTDVRAWRRRKA